ncbi:MAG TPA: nucleotide exchange factor GrpE [Acidimicrobiia bacterium]|nr:nucleotide exchange factor GrpE [Acidimicrobiia bacterium]
MSDEAEAAVEDAAADEAEADLDAVLTTLAKERDELRELAQRVQADFENYRKRMLRDQTEAIARANEGLIEGLLPVVDSFELALKQLDDVEAPVRKGVELVFAGLIDVLDKAGLERIESTDVPFDPNVHEAVMQEGDQGDPVVVDTVRSGYRLKGRVLRPAMVKVARKD